MKKYNGKDIIISAIALIFVVVVAAVLGVLKNFEIININASAFLVTLAVLTLGFGAYVIGFSIVKKGGYEYAVGAILFIIGVSLALVCFEVNYVINIIVTFSLLLIALISAFLFKTASLKFVTSDKEENYIPYMEKLKIEKENEVSEELPEIKSFKD